MPFNNPTSFVLMPVTWKRQNINGCVNLSNRNGYSGVGFDAATVAGCNSTSPL